MTFRLDLKTNAFRVLGLAEANALADDLCAGLSEAHRLEPPLLHLDLTTGNILVTEQGGRLDAKIADFGIAAQVHPVTRMARAQGTYYFMAPEMFWGYATPASDVYMLGFILYWLYAGPPHIQFPTCPRGLPRRIWRMPSSNLGTHQRRLLRNFDSTFQLG